MIVPNYEILDLIAESPRSVIYKARHKKNPEKLVTVKVLRAPIQSDQKKSQFRQRIEHLRVLNDPLIIVPSSFETLEGACFVAQDYFDGVSLDRVLEETGPLPLPEFFAIACKLLQALDKVHEAGIVHGGIKPHNILVNRSSMDLRLIDFMSAIDVRDVSHFIYDPSFIRDTLSYTSPEQTGRINHRVGFASDMYSLGIVFYEMLTGRVPFSSDDPLEVIHSHLAEEAPKVHELRPEVPSTLSKIVAKLILKEPEKRYQSSNGLLADLIRCRDEYTSTGTISEFSLESCVYTHRVTFVSKMVGRNDEAKIILREYENVAKGEFRSLFISGLSGIGKTRLIQELQKPIVTHRGYFTSGKFDLYQKNIPYSSLIQALRNLMRTFLTESDARVRIWRDKILGAVGQNGKVLTDVIPELEVLIGPQSDVQSLPPVESLNRFHDVFDMFLSALASKENPLALFIDDLQWCDIASFDFFANLFSNYNDHPYLFFIGAYRHNEVDPSHPLMKLIWTAHEARQPIGEIRLGPLRPEHCHEMVSYILDAPPHQTKALADFITDLSEGNPLFVSESLSYLHNEDLLYLDKEGQWRWDIERIRHSRMPKTVVALFSSKLHKLPGQTVNLLEYCACMGNDFSPTELASIRGMTLLETYEGLKPALGQGLLMESKSQLQFIHDKVQEAALEAIPPRRRREIHWHVGTHLLSLVPEGADLEKLENLFTIVSHLNLGREEQLDHKTSYTLSDLNYHAGNKALDALATEAANEYFTISRQLLPQDCWSEDRYERTFKIYQKAAKTELMCGNYEGSERLLDQLLAHAKTDLDKAECLAEQTTSLSSIGNFIKAIETANRGLAYFGKAIPEDPEAADTKRGKLMASIAQENCVWETILHMPFTTDRRSKIELKFYSELIPDLYMSGLVPHLYLSAAQSTQHCLEGGMDESVIYSFSIMGLQLGEQEEFEQAFKYEDLARDLSAKYPNTFGATRGMNGIVWCNAHSRSHPREIVDYCLRSIQCGKNCGDLYNAGLSYGPLMWNLQVQGENLAAIEEYAKECLQFSNRYHLSFSVGLAEAMQAGWVSPMKKGYTPVPMEEKLREWEAANHVASAGSYYVHLALTHYYFGDHVEAERCLEAVRGYLTGLTDNVLKRQWYVFRVLNSLKLYERGLRFEGKDQLIEEIGPLIGKVETWAALGPLLRPYLAFIRAEVERVTGQSREARNLYLDAISVAHELEYAFLEGHLNECLGELLRETGFRGERMYFVEAARLYRKCRAERKEIELIERHPEYFEEDRGVHISVTAEPALALLPDLDVEYLVKSSLAISAEIELESLLKKIMTVVIENSGAQHGYLLIEEEGDLWVRAESHVAEHHTPRTLNRKVDEIDDICKAIVRYVYRTGEKMIFSNASTECPLRGSPDCQNNHMRSLLCLPILKQAKMVGILYLENRLFDSVFTPERTQLIELLTSQTAISLENARLISEIREAERTLMDAMKREQFLANLVRNASVAVMVGYPDGQVGISNLAFQILTGYEEEELHGLSWNASLTPPEWRQLESEKLLELRKTRAAVKYEKEFSRKDGTRVPVELVVHPFFDGCGNIVQYYSFITDIAERKRSEADIKRLNESLAKRAAELEASNKELEAFSYSVSHDLRAPLRSMEGFSQALTEDYGDMLDEVGRDYLRRIQDSSTLMAELLEDLLRLSGIARAEMKRERIDLSQLAHEVCSELRKENPERRVEVRISPGLVDHGDSKLLRSVLRNLLDNAWKFTAKKPLSKVEFGMAAIGEKRAYFIRDNGAGFDMAYIDKLFLPFHRLHRPSDFPGTGIGLASVQRIIRRHGGEVWAEGALGDGATFYFTLGQ